MINVKKQEIDLKSFTFNYWVKSFKDTHFHITKSYLN